MSDRPTDSSELSKTVPEFDRIEDRLVRALELHGDGPAREPLNLLLGEVRVMRRRALNISRFCAHPASRGGAE